MSLQRDLKKALRLLTLDGSTYDSSTTRSDDSKTVSTALASAQAGTHDDFQFLKVRQLDRKARWGLRVSSTGDFVEVQSVRLTNLQMEVLAEGLPALVAGVLTSTAKGEDRSDEWWAETFLLLVFITEMDNGVFVRYTRLYPDRAVALVDCLVGKFKDGKVSLTSSLTGPTPSTTDPSRREDGSS